MYDKETGLYYYNARFYDPEDGRFLTQDTYRGENMEPDTLHLYAYCANNPVNYVDPSGHSFFYLNSSNGAAGAGHAAILIKYKGKWRYYSWEGDGYKSKKAQLKTVKKGIKGKTINKSFNKAKNVRRPAKKPYNQYIYIGGGSKKSYNYAKEIKAGKHYKKYRLVGRNCAWVAIDILRRGNFDKTIKSKLRNLQYTKKNYIKTIIPNFVVWTIANIFSTEVKKIK